jgi:hypothetical protein
MRAILFVIAGIVLANIVFATFFATPQRAEEKPAIINAATERGQDPWATNEPYIESARRSARKSALEALTQPTVAVCTAEGRKKIVDALKHYYWQRASQLRGYPSSWGDAGARYIVRAWSTAEDSRVDRLTRETYGRGYFGLDEFKSLTRDLIVETVRGQAPGKSCVS